MTRQKLSITGPWRFQPDPFDQGQTLGYFKPDHDAGRWRQVAIPSSFDHAGDGLDFYQGVGWYRRTIEIPQTWHDKHVAIRFEGVNHRAGVWLNGRLVGHNDDGFGRFELPISNLLDPSGQNVIVVRVDNTPRDHDLTGTQKGWRNCGGILREVELIATDPCHITHTQIVAEPLERGGHVRLEAHIANQRHQPVLATITGHILDQHDNICASFVSPARQLSAGHDAALQVEGLVPDVRLWHPDDPALYTARVDLAVGNQTIDSVHFRFGFRRIQAQAGQLLLNDQPIFLTGFNRHEDSPRTGMCTDLETARRDLTDMKRAGANFVRLCHYPHHPGELDLCDQLGLLVMGEIPLYWWQGLAGGRQNRDQQLDAAKRQLTKMIRRDLNHPSIIFWSVSNETHEQHLDVAEANAELIRLARRLDPTRLAVHVSHLWRQHPHFDEDDVICVNNYPTLNNRDVAGRCNSDLSASTSFWADGLSSLHQLYPDKPILVSEFGFVSLEGVFDSPVGEDLQARAIEAEFAGMTAPYICGATVWCYADHAWPPGSFGGRFVISPYGVLTRQRRKLQAFHTVKRLFTQRQGRTAETKAPSRPKPQPWYNVTMLRPDFDHIPQPPFPDGFTIRPMQPGEGGLWTDIQRDAEEYLDITDELFMHQFGYDLAATRWRCFFVTNSKGVAVATISAWYNSNFKGRQSGQIHWVATRPAYQRRGIGKAALSHALHRLAEWHDRCYLGTQTVRLPAIKLYLDFGFLPDLETPADRQAWRAVRDQLDHPAFTSLDL